MLTQTTSCELNSPADDKVVWDSIRGSALLEKRFCANAEVGHCVSDVAAKLGRPLNLMLVEGAGGEGSGSADVREELARVSIRARTWLVPSLGGGMTGCMERG